MLVQKIILVYSGIQEFNKKIKIYLQMWFDTYQFNRAKQFLTYTFSMFYFLEKCQHPPTGHHQSLF